MAHHGVSGLVGKLVTQLEVNCDADIFYKIVKHHEEVPNVIPHFFTGVQVTKGDGLVSGCIKEWNYILGLTHHIIEGDLMKDYKKFDVIVKATPKPNGHGSVVTYSILYEKINGDSPAPFDYLKFYHQNILDMSAHICASA
ncbi:hypothetical protein MKW92_024231 [Papaver armeniacum]|nr:hypothetical protein MKW92_024231 [Papaver armeniacum]